MKSALNDIKSSTIVTFPSGDIQGSSVICFVQQYDKDKILIITDQTPFHPLSNSWPDQEADTGKIQIDGTNYPVVDCLTVAFNPSDTNQKLLIDTQIPSKRETEDWYYLVAHIVQVPSHLLIDELVHRSIILEVDEKRRKSLSVAHTSGHLAGFALSKAAADLWRKEVKLDGLGNPDLDQLAMEYSRMTPTGDTDKYRFGKSLRKKGGFDNAAFFDRSNKLAEVVNNQVRLWLDTGADITIETTDNFLESQRYWVATLDEKHIKLPCGGTHPKSLKDIASITVSFDFSPETQEITMYTKFILT